MRDFLYALTPSLAMFGPLTLALVIPLQTFTQQAIGVVGAFGVGLAILSVFLRQREIVSTIDPLVANDERDATSPERKAKTRPL